MTLSISPLRHAVSWLVTVWLAVVFAADFLFFRHPLGWSIAAYGWGLLVLIIVRRPRCIRTRPGSVVALLVLTLLAVSVSMPSWTGVLLISLGILSLSLSGRTGWPRAASEWFQRWARFVCLGWRAFWRDQVLLHRWRKRHPGAFGGALGGASRWVLPVTGSLVFIALFAAANPLIAKGVDAFRRTAWELLRPILQLPTPARVTFWAIAAMWGWALLRGLPGWVASRRPGSPPPVGGVDSTRLIPSSAVIVRSLALFNIVFAAQNALDVKYLWYGAELPAGMTYAEYAHRGAYPLILTALLAAGFVLVTFHPTAEAGTRRCARRLVYAWIAQNIFLTASAGWRLGLYVQVYSLTRLRVAAALWSGLVALGLLWICVRIARRRSNTWLINVNVLSLFLLLFACSFVDIDGAIARYNVRRCAEITGEGVPLDVEYLTSLGPESMPAFLWLLEQDVPEGLRGEVRGAAEDAGDRLRELLGDWRGWTWSRSRLDAYADRFGPS